jgi:hypothetical protein
MDDQTLDGHVDDARVEARATGDLPDAHRALLNVSEH